MIRGLPAASTHARCASPPAVVPSPIRVRPRLSDISIPAEPSARAETVIRRTCPESSISSIASPLSLTDATIRGVPCAPMITTRSQRSVPSGESADSNRARRAARSGGRAGGCSEGSLME